MSDMQTNEIVMSGSLEQIKVKNIEGMVEDIKSKLRNADISIFERNSLEQVFNNLINAKMWLNKVIHGDF